MKQSVLLLEDDVNLGTILQEHLQLNGFTVRLCANGEDGHAAYRKRVPDLCLVDVMMPRKDGFTFAREVRHHDQKTPIIFLTARAMKGDRIEGLKIGADDYITKPFSMEELLLRIHAVLKRAGKHTPAENAATTFAIGKYAFDALRRTLRREGKSTKLTAREADLLRLLCLRMNATLDRSDVLKELWGDDSYYNGRSMDVFVSRLRRYLEKDSTVEILNVHGKGLKLVVGETNGA